MLGEHALAEGIERLGLCTDSGLERLGNIGGKGKRIEDTEALISGVVAYTHPATCAELPKRMWCGTEPSENKRVIVADHDSGTVELRFLKIEENECRMLGNL